MYKRLHTWQVNLADAVAVHQELPFEYGRQDCCTFAAACVRAVTGREALAAWGSWRNEREALRAVHGSGGLRAAVGATMGDEIAPLMAQPGDVGLFLDGGRETVAVWLGSAWMAPAADGLTVIDPAAMVCAWRCTGGT